MALTINAVTSLIGFKPEYVFICLPNEAVYLLNSKLSISISSCVSNMGSFTRARIVSPSHRELVYLFLAKSDQFFGQFCFK